MNRPAGCARTCRGGWPRSSADSRARRTAASISRPPPPRRLLDRGHGPLCQRRAGLGRRTQRVRRPPGRGPVSAEAIFARDPDVIVSLQQVPRDPALIGQRPGWHTLRAVRTNARGRARARPQADSRPAPDRSRPAVRTRAASGALRMQEHATDGRRASMATVWLVLLLLLAAAAVVLALRKERGRRHAVWPTQWWGTDTLQAELVRVLARAARGRGLLRRRLPVAGGPRCSRACSAIRWPNPALLGRRQRRSRGRRGLAAAAGAGAHRAEPAGAGFRGRLGRELAGAAGRQARRHSAAVGRATACCSRASGWPRSWPPCAASS